MWTIVSLICLAAAFAWLAYQLYRGGQSNEALQIELRATRSALAETNRKNQELQTKLAETNGKLDSCTKALNDQ